MQADNIPTAITGLFIDPENGIAEKRTVEYSLDDFYTLLDCDTIDIVKRFVGGRSFEIVIDDEGALKESPVISAMNSNMEPMLVGKLFVCKLEGEGELGSLSDDEIKRIRREYVVKCVGMRNHKLVCEGPALLCEYD